MPIIKPNVKINKQVQPTLPQRQTNVSFYFLQSSPDGDFLRIHYRVVHLSRHLPTRRSLRRGRPAWELYDSNKLECNYRNLNNKA